MPKTSSWIEVKGQNSYTPKIQDYPHYAFQNYHKHKIIEHQHDKQITHQRNENFIYYYMLLHVIGVITMPITLEDIEITRHAAERMVEKGINENEVLRVLQRGAKIRQKDGFLASHGNINIAYIKTKENKYRIKTVMLE